MSYENHAENVRNYYRRQGMQTQRELMVEQLHQMQCFDYLKTGDCTEHRGKCYEIQQLREKLLAEIEANQR